MSVMIKSAKNRSENCTRFTPLLMRRLLQNLLFSGSKNIYNFSLSSSDPINGITEQNPRFVAIKQCYCVRQSRNELGFDRCDQPEQMTLF